MTMTEIIENGEVDLLKDMLSSGVDPNIELDDTDTPLILAAYEDQAEIARLLLDAGADMYKPNDGGETPILMAGQRGSIGVFRLLLEYGYRLDVERDNAAYMFTCAKHIDIVRYLLAQGIPVDTTDDQGCTALTYAAHRNDRLIVTELIRAGANVNHRDDDGETVLMWTADTPGNAEMLRLLIENGAEVNAMNDQTDTGALYWTMWHGDCEMIQVLIDSGVRVDQPHALALAYRNGFTEAVRILVANGANSITTDSPGNSSVEAGQNVWNSDNIVDITRTGGNGETVSFRLSVERPQSAAESPE